MRTSDPNAKFAAGARRFLLDLAELTNVEVCQCALRHWNPASNEVWGQKLVGGSQ